MFVLAVSPETRVAAWLSGGCVRVPDCRKVDRMSAISGRVPVAIDISGNPCLDGSVSRTASPVPNLKILHVLDHSVPMMSGYSMRSLAILLEQRRRGWQTAQLTSLRHTASGPPLESVSGFDFHRASPVSRSANGFSHVSARLPYIKELAFISHLAAEIERVALLEKADIIHAHSSALNGIAALRAGKRLHRPVVYEVRAFWEDAAVDHGTSRENGIRYRLTRALETHVLRRCQAAITICEGLRADIVARGIPAAKISVVPNGVSIEDFVFQKSKQPAAKNDLGLSGQTVFGFIGSFYAYEGLDLLLDAFPMVLRRYPDTTLLLVGSGPAADQLRQQARRLNIGEKVRFVGRVPHEAVQAYYSAVDILVYPRHRMRLTETVTPLKPLEAMAQGGVVLASDVGGHRELVAHGATGWLFPADDSEALSRAMMELLATPEDWGRVRVAARKFVECRRTWEATTAEYVNAYARARGISLAAAGSKSPTAAGGNG
ncbi:MAG TPA: TIGR04063 family PEP-CTERM/XrtA system glycosyltransferase [Rhizomicrobium sp.]|jgi:PEP-CTERM/exosortase A-associated glycosyltransferase|nr:TIGR04063 family PEP-CTERM/XrtA system glycosyltransferase [Rhizomicrobium sp.]